MNTMATHTVVESLKGYAVPLEELWEENDPTYTFRLNLKLTRDKKNNPRYEADPVLPKIVSALLNTSGGLVILAPEPPETYLESVLFTDWKTRLKDMLNFLPPDEFHRCVKVEISDKNDQGRMHIRKSKNFVTAESHMHTRGPAVNAQVQLHSCLSQFMSPEFHQPQAKGLPFKGPFKYDSTFPNSEGANIELKCFQATSAKHSGLIARITEDQRCRKTIFGMGNVPNGGYIVFGIDDDMIIKGQTLEEEEDNDFEEKLADLLRKDRNGADRIWGKPGVDPIEGTHWTCDFIPVEGTPKDMKRRVVIIIHIFGCTGGVFEKTPKAFVINDDGYIAEVTFQYWKSKHVPQEPTSGTNIDRVRGPPHVSTSFTSTSPSPKHVDGTFEMSGSGTDNLSASVGSTSSFERTRRRTHSSGTFEDDTTITYTQHSSYSKDCEWAWPLSDVRTDSSDGPFQQLYPLKYTPSRETISRALPYIQDKQVIDYIEQATNGKGFVIAADTLFHCIEHSSAMSFGTTQTKLPPEHTMDLLVISEDTPITVYVLCEKINDKQKSYAVSLARILTKKILEGIDTDCISASISVRYCILETNESVDLLKKLQHHKADISCRLEDLCAALAKLFIKVKNHFRDDIIQSAELKLSKEQTHVLLCTDQSKINIIEGAPGSGKTILAQSVCESIGKDTSAYITTSKSLANQVNRAGKAEAFYVKNASDVVRLLREDPMKSRTHIVIDDCQNLPHGREDGEQICDHIMAVKERHIYVFQDSRYQNYQHKSHQITLGKKLFDCAESNFGSCFFKTLNHIQRNSYKIGSYIGLNAWDLSHNHDVTSVSSVAGDDITIKHTRELRRKDATNGLLRHIQRITKNNITAKEVKYSFKDIAILCEGQGDAQMFGKLFKTYYPESNPHTAEDDASEEGIIIDNLPDFSGLERKVVVYICPRPQKYSQHAYKHATLANPKYRIAIVSRAIHRVDILKEENIDEQMAYEMKCDDYPNESLKNSQGEMSVFLGGEDVNTDDTEDLHVSSRGGEWRKPSQVTSIGPIAGSIALTSAGNILCCFPDNGVHTFSLSTSGSTSTSSELYPRRDHLQPYSVAMHQSTGNIAVAYHPMTTRDVCLHIYDKVTGVWSESSGLGLGQWPRITWTTRGDIIVCLGDHQMKWYVVKYNPQDGEVWRQSTACGDVNDVAVDSKDQIYCCDSVNNSIAMYSQAKDFIQTWSLQDVDRDYLTPVSLCLDKRDHVYVMHREKGERGNTGVVTVWTTDGQYLRDIVQGLPDPYRLSSACMRLHNGHKLIVALYGTIRVYSMRPSS